MASKKADTKTQGRGDTGKKPTATTADPGQYRDLSIAQIVEGDNYRKHFDKASLKELAASIKEEGVLQPVIVRPKGKLYEMVAGWRRWKAAGMAGLKTIPAIVRKLDDKQVIAIQLTENSQRENPNPMDEAEGFKRALANGYTVASITDEVGVSPSYVYSRLKLLEMDKACQKSLLSGDIEMEHAKALLRISDKAEQKQMLESILEQDMSPAQARDAIRQDYGRTFHGAVFDTTTCGKCDHLSSTQGKLFGDVREEGDDRCMNEKCFIRKSTLALEVKAKTFSGGGWPVVSGSREAINKMRMKGRSIIETMKPKCKACQDRIFYWSVAEGYVQSGWWCPSNKCYGETVLGIKPREKQKPSWVRGEGSGEEPTDGGQEPTGQRQEPTGVPVPERRHCQGCEDYVPLGKTPDLDHDKTCSIDLTGSCEKVSGFEAAQ